MFVGQNGLKYAKKWWILVLKYAISNEDVTLWTMSHICHAPNSAWFRSILLVHVFRAATGHFDQFLRQLASGVCSQKILSLRMVSNTLITDEHFRFLASNTLKTDKDEAKILLSNTLISDRHMGQNRCDAFTCILCLVRSWRLPLQRCYTHLNVILKELAQSLGTNYVGSPHPSMGAGPKNQFSVIMGVGHILVTNLRLLLLSSTLAWVYTDNGW